MLDAKSFKAVWSSAFTWRGSHGLPEPPEGGTPNVQPSRSPAGPTEFGGCGTRIGVALVGAGTDHFVGDVSVKPAGKAGGKGFFHTAIFTGMKCQNGHPAAGIQARGQVT